MRTLTLLGQFCSKKTWTLLALRMWKRTTMRSPVTTSQAWTMTLVVLRLWAMV